VLARVKRLQGGRSSRRGRFFQGCRSPPRPGGRPRGPDVALGQDALQARAPPVADETWSQGRPARRTCRNSCTSFGHHKRRIREDGPTGTIRGHQRAGTGSVQRAGQARHDDGREESPISSKGRVLQRGRRGPARGPGPKRTTRYCDAHGDGNVTVRVRSCSGKRRGRGNRIGATVPERIAECTHSCWATGDSSRRPDN